MAQPRCSQFGEYCSQDQDCLQSCPFGAVPMERMACVGTEYEKARSLGKCQAAWAQATDPCVLGSSPSADTCAPGPLGVNNLYCQQSLDVYSWPNFAPTFAQPMVGQGFCMPRTMPPGPPLPVECTQKFLNQLQYNGQLQCRGQTDAEQKAYSLCNNVRSVICDYNKDIQIVLQ